MMREVYICDAIRTPFGRYAGALSGVRPDDLAAVVLQSIVDTNPSVDWESLDDVILGCANQAGEDNRNVARMSTLLAGLPISVSGVTINRLCGSGMDAVGSAARTIRCSEAEMMIAGGVESMSRAPFVLPKAEHGFSRSNTMYDTTLGWRFVNDKLKAQFGVDSMMQTAENVAQEFRIKRVDQDRFALASQTKVAESRAQGFFDREIVPLTIKGKKGESVVVARDEHPRHTSMEKLAQLAPLVHADGTVTAGNSSGINDGACALLLASANAVERFGLVPRARVLGMATAGLAPRVMGLGPVPATRKLLDWLNMQLNQFEVIEVNEAFAAQVLAVLKQLGIEDSETRVNANGGAIALGHPLGASGARLITTSVNQLHNIGARYALCTMCIGVGQGISIALESVN